MFKIRYLFVIILFLVSQNVVAHEQFDDGWHVVVANSETERDKEWNMQAKVWAYYENGKEILRYSRLIGSHRGWGEAPENSLASFELTKKNGYYTFETDVRFTKDNVPVLIHDSTIKTLAKNNDLSSISETVYVKDLTYDELKNNYIFNVERLNHGKVMVLPEYNTNRITSFEEMLDFVKENKMFVFVELKEGTRDQIDSLVRISQEKNMNNNIRWISFYSDLLKYVRDYDDSASLGITASTTCDSSHNLYCGEDIEYYINKLKTDNNLVSIPGNTTFKIPSSSCAVNLPLNKSGNSQTNFVLDTIPQGKIDISESNIIIESETDKSVSYNYNGDGIVKCESSNDKKLTCKVDLANSKILIKSIDKDSSNEYVNVYATQGISYSASNDNKIHVNVETTQDIAQKNIKEISIEGYKLDFLSSNYKYKVKIKDEEKLKFNINLTSDEYTYTIKGNENLKNGSIIIIDILRNNKKVLSYEFQIEKGIIVDVPNTNKNIPATIIIISFISIVAGIVFLKKLINFRKKFKI